MVLSSTILDFYPRPPRGGRHTKSRYAGNTVIFLSTPSARRATGSQRIRWLRPPISIHALREEGDGKLDCGLCGHAIFLSTPSARRATPRLAFLATAGVISIHALREEGDPPNQTGRKGG